MPETGTGELITNAAPGFVGSHDIIFQSLDSWRPYLNPDGTYETVFYGSDVFEGTEKAWETVPVILGKRHPNTPYQINPAKALEESDGVVVGNLTDVTITTTGSPVLRSRLHLTDNAAENSVKSRKMSLSSGFISKKNEGKLTGIAGKVLPDHILLFWHDRDRRPQDMASMFLNSTEEGEMPEDDSIKKILSDFLTEFKTYFVPAKADPVMPKLLEQNTMVPNMTEIKIAELEKQIADSNELIKNMTETIDGYKKADADRAAAELETKWTLVKNSIAPGITATAETEAAARKEWELDATEFLIKNAIAKKPETTAEGVQFVTNSTPDESEKSYLELVSMTGGFRRR